MPELRFRNRYSSRVWVAIAFPNDACSGFGPPWGTRGWWGIDPGGEAFVLRQEARLACFYAEANDGAIWTGSQGPVWLPQPAFESCWGIGNTSPETRVVAMRPLILPEGNLYVNLVE